MNIPAEFCGLGGPITVAEEENPVDEDGQKLLGSWDANTRRLVVRAGLNPNVAAATFFHEVVHSLLWDSGVQHFFSKKKLEAICDAVGTGLARAGVSTPQGTKAE